MWKSIENFSNYEVSSDGEVRNKTTKQILKGRLSKSGYLQVSIKSDSLNRFVNQYIHRLVAIFFIDNPFNKREVNHKDGNKINNYYENLEWMTSSENQKHRHTIGIVKTSNRRVGKFKDDILIVEYSSIVEASKAEGRPRSSIDAVLQGTRKTLFGYCWRYLD